MSNFFQLLIIIVLMIDKLVGSDCYWKLLLSFDKLHSSDMLTQTSHLFKEFNNSFTIISLTSEFSLSVRS